MHPMKLRIILKKLLKVFFALFLVWSGKRILDVTGFFEKICDFFINPPIKSKLFDFLNQHYSIWEILLFGVLFVIGYIITVIIFRLLSGKQPKAENKTEKITRKNKEKNKGQLIKSNSRSYEEVLFRYDVCFDKNDIIFIENLTPYCLKHNNTPVKMIDNYHKEKYVCSIQGCDNFLDNTFLKIDNPMLRYSNIIVSELEKEWEELNK